MRHATLNSDSPPETEASARAATASTPRISGAFEGPPAFHGPRRIGVRPGHPLVQRVFVSGERPLRLEAEGLPDGVCLEGDDPFLLVGRLAAAGTTTIRLRATNAAGKTARDLSLVGGEQLTYAPPMGWNSWNCFGLEVTAGKVLANARALRESGLADLGWTFVNIDGGWEADARTPEGAVLPNPETFPDLPGLVRDIHALGLKAGIYSSPWTRTFGGQPGCSSGPPRGHVRDEDLGWYVGEHTFETANANQWAEWGFDYLKYDWNPMDLAAGRRMARALRQCGRDIFFNPVNSMRDEDPRAWARLADAFFLWRRREQGDRDLEDTWESVDGIGFRMSPWRAIASSGHWNDPDMLALGPVGWGRPRANRLNADEQRTHFSLWALLAGPLLMGGDLSAADPGVFGLLGNPGILAIHQDGLGKAAARVSVEDGCEVWAKELEGGALAVGFFNRDHRASSLSFGFRENGLPPECDVRDVWAKREMGKQPGVDVDLPPHGCEIVVLDAEDPIPGKWIDDRAETTVEPTKRQDRF